MKIKDLWKAFLDYWEVFLLIGSAIYSAYQAVQQLNEFGLIQGGWNLGIGLILVLVFTVISVLKLVNKNRSLKAAASRKKSKSSSPKAKYNLSHSGSGDNQVGDRYYLVDDSKKKETLNELSRLLKIAVDDIMDYGIIFERTDKRTRTERKDVAYKSMDVFKSFSEKHIAEMSPQLNKLVFEKILPEMERVVRHKGLYWSNFNIRNDLIEQKIPYEQLPQMIEIDSVDEKMINFRDEIYKEIHLILNP